MGTISWQKYFKRHRGYRGVVAVLSVALVLFQIYTALFGSLDALIQRAIHLALGLMLVFLVYPVTRRRQDPQVKTHPGWWGIMHVFAVVASTAYIILRYDWVTMERFSLISPMSGLEIMLGLISIFLVIEAARRVLGISLVVVLLCFLAYPFVGPYLPGALHSSSITWTELLDFQYLGTAGIFGIPLGVSATEIAPFIILGSVFIRSGGAFLLHNVASSLAGRSPGGPAKVAIVASSIMGTISGSGTANVVTTGNVTIPMMKRAGYKPHFAAAVEAVASTGGQIMPPVMGAAAFVVSAFSGIPYVKIITYALFPAVLYYAGLLITVHMEALRLGLPGTEPEISLKEALRGYWHMLIPVALLIYLLFSGFTPRLSGGAAVLTALVVSQIRSTTRMSPADILEAFEDGAKGLLIVITATASAGLIIGVIDLTGLGQRLGAMFINLAGGQLFPALILGMLLAILLGMGMPTSAAYIIQAATVIPALIQMGLAPYIAHMFAFYYACLSLITPPVAISTYAAAGIAQSNMWQTGWTAFRLGLAGYIVPFMFVYCPSLLLVGSTLKIITTVITALVGVFFLAVSVEGYIMCKLSRLERATTFVTALLLITPSLKTLIPGLMLGAALLLWNYHHFRQERAISKTEQNKNAEDFNKQHLLWP